MFRHILSYCIVVSLFMIAAGTALSANMVIIDFENISDATVNKPVPPLKYPSLTVTFSTTNPNNCKPYLGDWGNDRQGWDCELTGTVDETVPPFAGDTWFMNWTECDARTYDMVIDFLPAVDKVKGSIFDVDHTEKFTITAYNANNDVIGGTPLEITPSPINGGQCGVQNWEVAGPGIRKLRFDGWKSLNYPILGFGIDNLMVTYTPALGPGINKDVTNIGTIDANDVSVVVKGLHPPTNWQYMGGFTSYLEIKYPDPVTGPNTLLKWSNRNGTDSPIPPGDKEHIGWRFPETDGVGKILDMWWTDSNGERILGSKICQTSAHYVYYTASQVAVIHWVNDFLPENLPPPSLTVQDIRYIKTLVALDMNSLNLDNDSLNAALISIPGTLTLAPGGSDSVQIPVTVAPNERIVVRYEVICPGDCGHSIDWVQTDKMVPSAIPTLTEWCLIIFGVVLLGFISWVFLKKKQVIGVRS